MKRSYSRIILTLLLTLTPHATSYAQEVPPDAIAVAQNCLDFFISKASNEDPSYFQREWKAVAPMKLDKVVLGKPFIIYLMNYEGICNYTDTSETDPLCCSKLRSYAFPVFSDGEYVMTIKAGKAVDKKEWGVRGEWGLHGWNSGDNRFDPWLLKVRETYCEKDGYTVSQLTTTGIGNFLIIQHNGAVIKIGAAAPGVTSASDGEYPWMDFATAVPLLKDAAYRHKMHQIEYQKRLEREQGQPPR